MLKNAMPVDLSRQMEKKQKISTHTSHILAKLEDTGLGVKKGGGQY